MKTKIGTEFVYTCPWSSDKVQMTVTDIYIEDAECMVEVEFRDKFDYVHTFTYTLHGFLDRIANEHTRRVVEKE